MLLCDFEHIYLSLNKVVAVEGSNTQKNVLIFSYLSVLKNVGQSHLTVLNLIGWILHFKTKKSIEVFFYRMPISGIER